MYGEEVDAVSTVALLIDDLSSEDPNAKLHSIQRLGQISTLLGPDRTVDELIPMLTELIDKIDSNPELMLNMAEQLGNLTALIASKNNSITSNVTTLLTPLETIVGNDDAMVREKAIEALKKVSELLVNSEIKLNYLPLCKRLKKGDMFSMRIAASQLYADIYAKLDQDDQEKVNKKFKKLCADDTPMVRWGAAQAVSSLCQHVSSQSINEFILPLVKELLNDKNDSVKVNAVAASVNVVKHISDVSKV